MGLALVAALRAYNGIHDMICVAGEVKDPGRPLPRAPVVGVASAGAGAAFLPLFPR